MPRHVDLGDHHDVPCGTVLDDVVELLVGVEEAGTPSLPVVLRIIQLRVLPALNSVAGVVGQVHVKDVELVLRHHVDEPLEKLDVLGITAQVMHEAA